MEKTEKRVSASGKKVSQRVKRPASTKDRIRPRGLWGLMKGKIHYNENEDIFNLEKL